MSSRTSSLGGQHLVLIGLTGSGKTTIGRLAAERLGLFVERVVGEPALAQFDRDQDARNARPDDRDPRLLLCQVASPSPPWVA